MGLDRKLPIIVKVTNPSSKKVTDNCHYRNSRGNKINQLLNKQRLEYTTTVKLFSNENTDIGITSDTTVQISVLTEVLLHLPHVFEGGRECRTGAYNILANHQTVARN